MLPPAEVAELPADISWSSMTAQEVARIGVTGQATAGQSPRLQFQVDPAPSAAARRAVLACGERLWRAMPG